MSQINRTDLILFEKNMKTMKTVWFFCVLTVLFRKYGELDNFVCLKDIGL